MNNILVNKENNSYFDGGLLSLIGHTIVAWAVIIFTLGIFYPWALCYLFGWKTNHTVIEGRRLKFTGTGLGLFGNWIKWWALLIVTFGIYGFWLGISIQKWKVKHTSFEN